MGESLTLEDGIKFRGEIILNWDEMVGVGGGESKRVRVGNRVAAADVQ